MAKRQANLSGIFSKTEGDPEVKSGEVKAEGRTVPVGVGLKESEVAMLDEIAGELGIARNALMRWGLRYFLKQYNAGNVDLETTTETKTTLRMP